ncbi:MAG: formate--tetrahydrofolate ligase [Candidatus Omnitrophica bacterium]|nr:formate--tetrahydrofolate ligase [Candidatus Omnitrophota bacterium]
MPTLRLKQIREIARLAGIRDDELELYGDYKAKVKLDIFSRVGNRPSGKLINVTAITPTKAGEGKTCTAIGLVQALGKLKKNVFLCLREPSLGPVFGIKGGATGGGLSQVLPAEDINLHFTGDIHAVGSAHNLLAAILDNHIYFGNELKIDLNKIVWRRCIDISDRQLRYIQCGLGGKAHGFVHNSGFDITVASEIMAILSLAQDIGDLKERLSRIIVAYNQNGEPVTAGDLKASGALAVLLKDAIKPNLVQTSEGQPAFIHGGPFANIAHGNNSIVATKLALKLANYVVTESGFGADLGMEKFFDIVCRQENFKPDLVVLVVSAKALKIHGGQEEGKIEEKNLNALEEGFKNLDRHIENISKFGVPLVVAINRFPQDYEEELMAIKLHCEGRRIKAVVSEVVTRGGEGGIELAEAVLKTLQEHPSHFKPLYSLDLPLKKKIEIIATELYGARNVEYSREAEVELRHLQELGFGNLPVNMAKTQYSFTDDPKVKGAPLNWTLKVREVRILAGAGFVVPVTGEMMLMPGLPKHPLAEKIDLSEGGMIIGLS